LAKTKKGVLAFMRGIISLSIIAALAAPCAALTQDEDLTISQTLSQAPQQECTAPEIATSLQMIHLANRDGDLVPVSINGVARNFLLDTGAYVTQVQRPVAQELALPVLQGDTTIYDLTGKVSRDEAAITNFTVGRLRGNDTALPVSPDVQSAPTSDEFFAMDHMLAYDIDLDFGTDKLTLYNQAHCPRVVPYWAMTATAVIPISLENNHIIVPVMLDGKPFRAWLDTGSTFSALDMDNATSLYGLAMGSADTPENGALNEEPGLRTYAHSFKSLTFGDVAIANPRITIIPPAMKEALERSRTGPATAFKPRIDTPYLIVGMYVLRKLHLYMALAENRIYISRASEPTAQTRALQASLQPRAALQARFRQVAAKEIDDMDKIIAVDPQNVPALNARCYMRAAVKTQMDAAQADCDKAAALRPRDDAVLDSRAFLLYQQGKYPEALAAYNQVLAINAKSAPSLFMRGYAKGMLGDDAGKAADIQAATHAMPDIQRTFQQYDISLAPPG
jgi:tetratricopeptide (TPR) repeat protein